jgi:hypothetical protein
MRNPGETGPPTRLQRAPHQQTQANKSIMAQELLKLAADGERDPTRLCELAVRTVEAPD